MMNHLVIQSDHKNAVQFWAREMYTIFWCFSLYHQNAVYLPTKSADGDSARASLLAEHVLLLGKLKTLVRQMSFGKANVETFVFFFK